MSKDVALNLKTKNGKLFLRYEIDDNSDYDIKSAALLILLSINNIFSKDELELDEIEVKPIEVHPRGIEVSLPIPSNPKTVVRLQEKVSEILKEKP